MTNKPDRTKILLLIIGILLIANMAILSFFLLRKDGGRPGSRADRKAFISNFLKKEIGFNEQQLAQYDTLSNRNHEKMKASFDKFKGSFDKISSKKEEEFKQLAAAGFSDSAISLVADQSIAAQKAMEIQMFYHLRDLRQLCTPEQLPRFDSLFPKVFNRRNEGRGKNEH